MKATDLRIGNYHYYTIEDMQDERKKWDEVCQIDAQDIVWLENNSGDEDFKPIPITEEWLVRFGFVKFNNKWNIGFNFSEYSVKEVGDTFNHWYFNHEFEKTKRITSNILYVHQLQNLYYCLTGEELQAEAGKEN